MTEFIYCAWLVPPMWLWMFARRDESKDESIGTELVASGTAAVIVLFCTFCLIHAVGLAWSHP